MPLLKKINDSWKPVEFPNIQVGDVVQFDAPFENLVRSGLAIIVDGDGNELELPGQMFDCPICFESLQGLTTFVEHVSTHRPKPKEKKPAVEKEVEKKEEKTADTKDDSVRAKRLAALEKARAARMAKIAAKKEAK